ncbi:MULTISPECIES: DUF4382 domain-containing protein [Mesotoga]|jgi:PBP1b-binding outer membrane lipoprotein LpoB|uniref:DUF4382 domain-containing protein n=1 Tax=Mesotoga TaxID=1184396 RepID=UPI0002CB4C7F|nr:MULTISPECIES: DUF4382 domain-containing protein [Mesotoga]MCP5457039.1 DUF4382 domain-containing protein [Thermotogota bacterium]CCU83957.1 conserved exported hypothetical protein [Mesotoga infera]MCB1223190.1 DUF4382 domain-containing protein [Mesotoga sp.]MCP5460258.1 DUF4382 domain-containing protein [Thermotogota bacterium]RLL81819.1 hypothetical protein Y696_04600 [Mesotoga sp. H07pep.5.4]
MKKLSLSIILLITLFFAGCMEFPSQEPDRGTVRVFLTDAVIPVEDIDSLMVRIDSISLYGDEHQPVVISDTPFEVDIVTLVGATYELPNTISVSGIYNQLRMEVGAATLTANGEIFPVTVNSGSLKINDLYLTIDENATTTIVLDFDLSKSLIINGRWEDLKIEEDNGGFNSRKDKVHMTPVLHVRHGSLFDVTGVASSSIYPLLVALFPESGGEALTTFTHEDNPIWDQGEFRFCKVVSGDYRIEFFDNYTDEGFSIDESESRYQPLFVTVVDRDVDLGTIVLVEK